MKVELYKDDLVNLVNGVQPNYHLFDVPIVKKSGYFMSDNWRWNNDIGDKLTNQELWELYILCRDSFKD